MKASRPFPVFRLLALAAALHCACGQVAWAQALRLQAEPALREALPPEGQRLPVTVQADTLSGRDKQGQRDRKSVV